MAKRFTDTEKWKDEWFLELEPAMKVFWIYLCDTCDNAGFWKENFKHASFFVGAVMDRQSAIKALGERVKLLPSKKWYIKKFIPFQYGPALYENNPAHKSVIHLLNFEGMDQEVEILPEAGGFQRKRISKSAREKVFTQAEFTCEYCGERPSSSELVIDHIIPVSKGGSISDSNLACSCVTCNARKSAMSLEIFVERHNLSSTLSEKIKSLIAPFKPLNAPNNFLSAPLDKEKDKDKEMEMYSSSLSSLKEERVKNDSEVKPDNLIELWNKQLPGKGRLSHCYGLSGQDLSEFVKTIGYKEFKILKNWLSIFSTVEKSEFLNGTSGNFVATLNWLCKHDSALKVLNGQYSGAPNDQKRGKSSKTTTTPDNPTGDPYLAQLNEMKQRGEIA